MSTAKERRLAEATRAVLKLGTHEGKLERLRELYDSAKEAQGGASLTIYQDVSDLMDRYDGLIAGGSDFGDIDQDFDNLCGRLRAMGGEPQ